MLVKPYAPDRFWSADEYLAWESKQEFKNELIDNRVWIMLGSSLRHNRILTSLIGTLYPMLLDLDYHVFGSRMCLEIDRDSSFVYPDMAIIRGEPQMSCRFNQHTFENPTVLLEILSAHTETMDRGRKKDLYLQLKSLEAYILVAQDKPRVEMFQRDGDHWAHSEYTGLESSLPIPSLDDKIPLDFIYSKVAFESDEPA